MYSIHEEAKRLRTPKELCEGGFNYGFNVKEDGSLALNHSSTIGYYFMKEIDTHEEGMQFNRLKLYDEQIEGVKLDIYIMASDVNYADDKGRFVLVDDVLQDQEVEPQEKLHLLQALGAKVYRNERDLLLHRFEGRYLFVALQVYSVEEANYSLFQLEIEYPKQSFIEYLPQVYQTRDDFFERYLGIFQSLYLDLEKCIDRIPYYLDIDLVDDQFIDYLGSWVGIDNSDELFTKKQLRKIIRQAVKMNGDKGTRHALEEILNLYIGSPPRMIEYFEWQNKTGEDGRNKKVYKRLYGEDFSWFVVIIEKDKLNYNLSKEKIRCLIERYKPINTHYHLVILDKCDRSDMHCYLGKNSYLTVPQVAQLNGKVRLTDQIIIKLE